MSELNRVIDKIEGIVQEVEDCCNDAINSIRVNEPIKTYEDFKKTMADSCCKIESSIQGIMRLVDEEMDWGRCMNVLSNIYGPSGPKVACHMAMTNENGGLYNVLKQVAKELSRQSVKNRIQSIVINYWDHLTADEKINAGKEYLEKYGHLLPSEFTESNGIRTLANFWKVLELHPYILEETRKVG
jgi:hypothetical protein